MKMAFPSSFKLIERFSSMSRLHYLLQFPTELQKDYSWADNIKDIDPNRWRHEEMDLASRFESGSPSALVLADRLLEINGSRIQFRHELEDEAQTLALQIHPYLLAASKARKILLYQKVQAHDLDLWAQHLTPGLYRDDHPHRDHADLHIHINGAQDATTSILHWCDLGLHSKNISKEIRNFTRLEKLVYSPMQILRLHQLAFQAVNTAISSGSWDACSFRQECNMISLNLGFSPSCSWTTWHYQLAPFDPKDNRGSWLKAAVIAFQEKKYSACLFYYYLLLLDISEDEKSSLELRTAADVFIITSNLIRNSIVMSSQRGLGYFVKLFRSEFQKPGNDISHGITQLQKLNAAHYEAKIGPKPKNLHANISHLVKINNYNDRKGRKFNFSIHFIKGPETFKASPNPLKSCRHAAKRKELDKESSSIEAFFQNPLSQAMPLSYFYPQIKLKADPCAPEETIDLTSFVVSLDAAGNECDTPPEVFAPSFRRLRRTPQTLSHSWPGCKHGRKLRLSLHAGEDFNHIVTGLRRIDESVRFCEMEQFDRLGHALALGLSPKAWMRDRAEVLLTREEFFDNLVWLWCESEALSASYPPAGVLRLKFERMVKEMQELLYPALPTLPAADIHAFAAAWHLRRNCPRKWNEPTAYHLMPELCPDRFRQNPPSKIVEQLFLSYHFDRIDARDEVVILRYSNRHSVEPDPSGRYYYLGDDELDMIEALQDAMITRLEHKGIIIEACPSSNITIGQFPIHEHPIFRWHPPKEELLQPGAKLNRFGLRRGIMHCCVNTDDPAIFPTTIQNEFKMLKVAAKEYHDCTETEAERWVETLRLQGLEIFKRNAAVYS